MANIIRVEDWEIITNMSAGGDYLAPCGWLLGHPNFGHNPAIPGTFVHFDPETLIGESISGRIYRFDRETFHPNGNATTLEAAIEFLQNKWTKTSHR